MYDCMRHVKYIKGNVVSQALLYILGFDSSREFVYDFNMKNIIRKTTEFAMYIVQAYIGPGDTVIDATCGNGHDTLALAQTDPARLYAFDVQEDAVRRTRELLENSGFGETIVDGRFIIKQLAHENIGAYCESRGIQAKAAIFNLGYLPGGDKSITTKAESTLAAVQAMMDIIRPDGLICITMYSGHPDGKEEKEALLNFAEQLDSGRWHTAYISMTNQKKDPPEILLITKKTAVESTAEKNTSDIYL